MIATGTVSKKLNCDRGQLRAMLFAAAWVHLNAKHPFAAAAGLDLVEEALDIAAKGYEQYRRYEEGA